MSNTSIRVDTVGLGINWALGETYRVQIDEGFLLQENGLNLPLGGGNITTFTTPNNPPLVSSTYPANGETTSEENKNITIAIDRANIDVISGNVYLYQKATPNVLIATYAVSSNIGANTASIGAGYYNNTQTITANIITIPINHYLSANTSYFVRIDANILQDRNGFKFAGISSNTAFAWTTSTSWQKDLTVAPVLTYNEDTQRTIVSPLIVSDVNNNIDYENNSYTLVITSNTNVGIRTLTINGSNWINNTHTLTGNANAINGQLSTLTLTPADDYISPITLIYDLTTPNSNNYSRSQTLICANTNEETLNLAVARTFAYGSTSQILMPTSPIQIGDHGVGSSDAYVVTLSSDDILIGFNNNNPLTISGSKTSVNATLANVVINNPTGYLGNVEMRYKQVRNNITQTQGTLTLTQSNVAGNPSATLANTTAYKVSSTYTDTYYITSTNTIRLPYELPIQFALIGGGGGGGSGTAGSGITLVAAGGGGGAGGVLQINETRSSANYNIVIGSGGASDTNGGNTTGFGYTAYGGGHGSYTNRTTPPGTVGTTDAGSIAAASGGSGGGGGMYSPDNQGNYSSHALGGNSIAGQGFSGGPGVYSISGGGGGAGGPGNVIVNFYPMGGGPGLTVFDGNTYAVGGDGAKPYDYENNGIVTIKGSGGHGRYLSAGLSGASGLAIIQVISWAAFPSSPTNIVASFSNISYNSATATISYTTSASSGPSSIVGYYAISSPGGLIGYVSGDGGGNITVANLSLATSYTFTVKAKNGYGNSNVSASSNGITAGLIPNAPTIGTAYLLTKTTSTLSANVSYTASTSDGGYPITSYTAISTPGNITNTLSTSGSGNITVSGLDTNTSYTFKVYATTSYGNSNLSSSSNSVSPTIANAPTIGLAYQLSNVSANISYTAPLYNGASDIISYTVISTPGNLTANISQAGSGNITVNGLETGIAYTFKVYATNGIGNSANSASTGSLIVLGAPKSATINSVTLANSSAVVISYTAPTNIGGNAITSYTAISTPGNITANVYQSGNGTITMTGLSADSYTFKVSATNYYGSSDLNSAISSNTVPVGANVYYDENYSNVTILATANTSSNAWVIDQSLTASNLSITSGESRITTEYIFNQESFLLNGYDYYNLAFFKFNRPVSNITTFTLEAYFKVTNAPGHGLQAGFLFNIDDSCYLQHLTNQTLTIQGLGMTVNPSTGRNDLGSMSVDSWHHVAMCKDGTNLRIFVDGTQSGSTQTVSNSISVGNVYIGGNGLYAFVDQIRFTPNVARYTTSFTSPSAISKNSIY